MDDMEAIRNRHSVRAYKPDTIPNDIRVRLQQEIDKANEEGSLDIRLVRDEPNAFDSTLAHYGRFSGVRNYLVLAGKDSDDLEERCGYYGECIVLRAQELGLNTCWVALAFKKRYVRKMLDADEKLVVVIAVGFGETQGVSHKMKPIEDLCDGADLTAAPLWFRRGLEAAQLAPTAVNQQSFSIAFTNQKKDGKPVVRLTNNGGSYSNIDLGIVRLHFEVGAGTQNFIWE